jgi:NYN domain
VDRCALFVDAGYVLADGGMAVHGTRRRDSVSWDYPGLLQFFGNLATERTHLPMLRCYWYEATVEGRRSAEHDALADLPGVKLRVAKMRPGRREGVEGEIHRDLTTLARNKAVSDAMVVTAEEDLTQVIADVQDMGMRVTLLQIASDGSATASRALRQECDDFVEVSAADLRPYVELISGAEPARTDESDPLPPAAVNGAGSANGHNGNGYNGNGQAPVPERTGYPQPPSRLDGGQQPSARPALSYQRGSEVPAADQPAQTAVLEQAQPEPEHADVAAATDLAPAGDFAANVDYSASVDYGAPAPAADRSADAKPPAVDYRSVPDYGPAADYLPAPAAIAPPAPSREDLYAVPAAPPADELPAEPDRLSAASRYGADLPAYAPGAVREHYQRDSVFRETGSRDTDRLVPAGIPGGGSAQIRRLPTRGAEPGPVRPSPGLPPVPAPVPGGSPLSAAQPAMAPPGVTPAGPAETAGGVPPGSRPPGGDRVTAAQPALPAAPGGPSDPNGMAYTDPRGTSGGGISYAGSRPAFSGPGGPVSLAGPGGPGGGPLGGLGANPGQGLGPASSGQPPQPPQVAPAPSGQQDLGPSGPIGLVGPGGYVGGGSGVSLADAVQSAHEEGQAFGESVARDAPALWLEAVLARKPRMPSDLEARLLQGSALPIDFLLHDEVRHALRRGFWDALERARR